MSMDHISDLMREYGLLWLDDAKDRNEEPKRAARMEILKQITHIEQLDAIEWAKSMQELRKELME